MKKDLEKKIKNVDLKEIAYFYNRRNIKIPVFRVRTSDMKDWYFSFKNVITAACP